MPQPVVVIVMGPPGVGKSMLAKRLAHRFQLAAFSKDRLKESLFDTLGWRDRDWSRQLGIASYRLLETLLESLLSIGHSCIIESNFRPEFDTPAFQRLQNRYGCRFVQVLCEADPETVIRRFRERVERGERHPGHADQANVFEHEQAIRAWKDLPFDLEGEIVRVRLDDFDRVDYAPLDAVLSRALSSSLG